MFDLKDYYKILRVSRLASADEIKRSYRRLASKFHPDVSTDPDSHFILTEINEAYGVLGNANSKIQYDQLLNFQVTVEFSEVFVPVAEDSRKRRHGKRETPEEKQKKQAFATERNISFNKRMRLLSILTFLLAGLIFLDHYLPNASVFQKAYPYFNSDTIDINRRMLYNLHLTNGKQINIEPIERNDEAIGLRMGEALFIKSPLLKLNAKIQVGKIIFKQLDGLYDLMLFFGIICLSSLYVLYYRLEESMVLPTILTFFNCIFVLAFFILWLVE